MITILDK